MPNPEGSHQIGVGAPLRLSLEPGSPVPITADRLQSWCEDDGTVIAYGWRRDADFWLRFPGLAAFRLSTTEDVVPAIPEGGGHGAIWETFERSVLPFALQQRGMEALHASAVLGPQGVIAMCARSGTGKSTLARALSGAGLRFWSDDSVILIPDRERPTVRAIPAHLRLRPASAHHFGADRREARSGARPGLEAPLAAIVVLEQDPRADGVERRRLDGAECFTAVLTHAYCLELDDRDRRSAMVRNYLGVLGRVPVHAVRFPTGLEHLPAVATTVLAAAAAEGTSSPWPVG